MEGSKPRGRYAKPKVNNHCKVCGAELCNDYSEHCREHYTQKQREAVYADDIGSKKRRDIPDLKCPDCSKQVRFNEGLYHRLKECCHPSFLDCSGSECHWSYIFEREVEHDD